MSDTQPSFRASWKARIPKFVKPNITSSVRLPIESSDTYQNLRENYDKLNDTVKDQLSFRTILTKTKEFIPAVLSSNRNQTQPIGFYDSIFSSETDIQDVYYKVAIICLWVIAILCMIPTIVTIVIPIKKYGIKPSGAKMIFLHILLCELFYLIYILLSLINVAQNFQLSSVFCKFANCGMYVTIPFMHIALCFLFMERLSTRFSSKVPWSCIFRKTYVTQAILCTIWVIFIAFIATVMLLKDQFWSFGVNIIKDNAPPILNDVIDKITSKSYECSIDGRLPSIAKVITIIIFVLLLLLIIKTITISILYNYFTPDCFKIRKAMKNTGDNYETLLFFIFLVLNLCLSFPFYFTSMAHTVRSLISKQETYPTSLKVCFLLRLCCIILQCLTFYTFENNSWTLLSRLLYHATCNKIPKLNNNNDFLSQTKHDAHNLDGRENLDRKQSTSLFEHISDISFNPATDEDKKQSSTSEIDSEGSDDVFEERPETVPLSVRKPTKEIDDDDDTNSEPEVMPKTNSFRKKKNIQEKRNKIRDQIKIDSMKKSTTATNNIDSSVKKIPKNKPPSESISSSFEDDDYNSNLNKKPDDSTKLFKFTMATEKKTSSSVNEQKKTTKTLKYDNQTRIHLQSFTSTNPHSKEKNIRRKKSSKNIHNHSRNNRLSKFIDNSDEV